MTLIRSIGIPPKSAILSASDVVTAAFIVHFLITKIKTWRNTGAESSIQAKQTGRSLLLDVPNNASTKVRWENKIEGYIFIDHYVYLHILKPHFLQQMLGVINDSCDPQYISNVDAYRTAVAFIPSKVVDRCFERSIEINANQFTRCIENRAA